MLEEQAMITFLKKFDEHPFLVKINGHEHLIGEGAPTFTVNFKKVIPLKDLVTSTSLAYFISPCNLFMISPVFDRHRGFLILLC